MRNRLKIAAAAALTLLLVLCIPEVRLAAQQVGDQVLLNMTFVSKGPSTQGARILQTGEVNTLTSAVASATLTEVVAAPASGSIYLRAIFIEKSTTATGSVLVRYGTGTNCGTGTTTLVSLTAAAGQIFPFGYVQLGIQVPATKALCLGTDASTTSVRALTN